MRVCAVRLTNYRCFEDTGEIPLSDFAVFMGRNDGGKSSALLAIYKVLQGRRFDDEDHRVTVPAVNGTKPQRAAEMIIGLRLTGTDGDLHCRLRRTLAEGPGGSSAEHFEVEGPCVEPAELNCDLEGLGLADLRDLCARFELLPSGPKNQKASWIEPLEAYRSTLPAVWAWKPVSFTVVRGQLPRAFLYHEEAEPNPEAAIRSFLSDFYKNELLGKYETQLVGMRGEIETGLNAQAERMVPVLQEYCPTVERVSVELGERTLTALDIGRIRITQAGSDIDWSRIGRGRRREMSLAVFCWQQEILASTLTEAEAQDDSPEVIALFDEPDMNLDYEAQRKVAQALTTLSNFRLCQVVAATHSVNLIDSARLDQVTFFGVAGDPRASGKVWRFAPGDGNQQITETLTRSLGLRNSIIFNERLFVICEGDTEIRALELLFPEVARKTLGLAGVFLLNGQSDGQALAAAHFLRRNHRQVLLMVDRDVSVNTGRSRYFTSDKLRQAGLDPAADVFLIGEREFEDLFENEVWEAVLNRNFPRVDGLTWSLSHVEALRQEAKFSDAMLDAISVLSEEHASKPKLGHLLASVAIEFEMIPPQLGELIARIVERASMDQKGERS